MPRGKTVFVFGAGVSKAAGFPLGSELMSDLRSFLGIHTGGQWEGLAELWDDAERRKVFLSDDAAEMNFTRLEIAARTEPGDRKLFGFLPRLIYSRFEQIHQEARVSGRTEYLRCFVRRHVRPGDAILTFNYDCMVEQALAAENLWQLRFGYGLDFGDFYQELRERETGTAVEVIKLHGSMGWVSTLGPEAGRTGFSQGLPGELHERELLIADGVLTLLKYRNLQARNPSLRRPGQEFMILPTYFKKLSVYPFSRVWKQAADHLQGAGQIVSIGYSMPEADSAARALLLAAIPAGARLDYYSTGKDILHIRALEQFFQAGGIRFRDWAGRIEVLADADVLPADVSAPRTGER